MMAYILIRALKGLKVFLDQSSSGNLNISNYLNTEEQVPNKKKGLVRKSKSVAIKASVWSQSNILRD